MSDWEWDSSSSGSEELSSEQPGIRPYIFDPQIDSDDEANERAGESQNNSDAQPQRMETDDW